MVGLGRLPDESRDAVADGPDGFRGPTERVAAASWVASSRAVRVAAPDGDVDATELGGVTEAGAICGTGETATAGVGVGETVAGLCLHPARGSPRSTTQVKASSPDGMDRATSAAQPSSKLMLFIPATLRSDPIVCYASCGPY
jgi:hypothetical protein